MTKSCANCAHWTTADGETGACEKLLDAEPTVTVESRGNVEIITSCDFGCRLFERAD